ncbi:DUF4249 domain-containing protein [Owenweeksia hongkongensis]|uniref:DUF4249 domain-containing protein n=1 Tax=Owenweeksia hongkongensis TaxID=253245 RepID=UPI003A928A2B
MKRFLILSAVALILASCEKVIDVDLNSSDPQMVLEANLPAGEDSLWISISQTADYFSNDPNPVVDGADIEFTDGDGNIMQASPMGNGRYLVMGVKSMVNRTYSIKADVQGQITQAESYMPPTVLLDSITFEYFPPNDFSDASYSINVAFQDPPDTINYYQIVVRVNGQSEGDITVFSDKFNQGTYLNLPLFGYEIGQGDVVEVELQSIDADVYEYFVTLASIVSQTGPPGIAPGNPTTNLKGDIQLGYFGTYSHSSILDTIQ